MEKKNCIDQKDLSLCTGCMACMDACPAMAITEGFTSDGFRIPSVFKDKCVKCGKCVRVCGLHADRKRFSPIAVFRMASKDDSIRMNCSSGGVFALLAQKTVANGGVVIGAVFDANCKDVRHATSDEYRLVKIYRSKYVQSNMIGIYQKTESILMEGRNVLFCGTPCQVRALHSFLKGKRCAGILVTVDFMCHGVPSTIQFKKFIAEREEKEKSPVMNVTFREKDEGWRTQIIKTYHENGKVWKKASYYCCYYYMFLNSFSLRDSCYTCEEYQAHTADITLADDWVGNANDNIGTSRVFVNTLIGKQAILGVINESESVDITEKAMSEISIYSHAGYDYGKKVLWKGALETGGYKRAETFLFYRYSAVSLLKYKLREQVSKMKRIVKKAMKRIDN